MLQGISYALRLKGPYSYWGGGVIVKGRERGRLQMGAPQPQG